MEQHSVTRRSYEEELAELDQQLTMMSGLAGDMIIDAVRSVQERNLLLAESVIRQDETVNALDANIESRCVRLLALQQPVGHDLRRIVASLKAVTDIERVGDHAVDIGRVVEDMRGPGLAASPVDLMPIAQISKRMLERAVAAIFVPSGGLVGETAADFNTVSDTLQALLRDLYESASASSTPVATVLQLQLVAVYLERVAAHATNIAERAEFVRTAEAVPAGYWRHGRT
jgi:phosphate transport system protein